MKPYLMKYARMSASLAALMLVIAASTPAASSRSIRHMPGHNTVNVNVSVNMQIPMADDSTEAMAAAQIDGRKIIYRLATSECPILLETIANSCRLTNLNVSTQIRHQNSANPFSLHISGNAQFAIVLKDADQIAQ